MKERKLRDQQLQLNAKRRQISHLIFFFFQKHNYPNAPMQFDEPEADRYKKIVKCPQAIQLCNNL